MEFRSVIFGTILLFLALVAAPYFAIQFDYMAGPIPIGRFQYFGVLMMLIGSPLAVWSALFFMTQKNTIITRGPYKYLRNPFMLGWLFILWGEVIFLRSWPLLFYSVILSLCIHFWVIAFEEPSLEDKFGEQYRSYKRQVPRWIPRF